VAAIKGDMDTLRDAQLTVAQLALRTELVGMIGITQIPR
jgi:hypothetical protein